MEFQAISDSHSDCHIKDVDVNVAVGGESKFM